MAQQLQIAQPITLPCGLTLPNRLVKAAMAENMAAAASGLPNDDFVRVYDEWAKGGWGMVLTGNVMIDHKWLGDVRDTAYNHSVEYAKQLELWTKWAATCQSSSGTSPTIVQINHAGRQAVAQAKKRGWFDKPLAPSAIPLDFGNSFVHRLAVSVSFGNPRAMVQDDIDSVVKGFVTTARLASEAGFAGIQIHAAHGYLLAQFLSPKSNQRTDAYGGSARARAKIVVDIIHAVRKVVPREFCVGMKLNSVDHQSAEDLQGCLEQLDEITTAGIDFLEISGGTYEDPTFILNREHQELEEQQQNQQPTEKSARTKAREAFFIEFAESIRKAIPNNVPLVLTGGFRTRVGMESALSDNACDMVGIARPAVMNPHWAKDVLLNPAVSDEDATIKVKVVPPPLAQKLVKVKALGASAEAVSYDPTPTLRTCEKKMSWVRKLTYSFSRLYLGVVCCPDTSLWQINVLT
ncbi:NADPH dehydrogenase [Microdochium trichocladiopsis]|uniref:NADPH dehydrogenase n=1 Tax=Microdochium trichocladiopsis TaxID=1682393 RepID=A0A9P9BLB8_9PEZI|nr:NADPH dehydrogenase [Microdochium trichocladiopsis]KAH7024762.1 NADPH dehydrogenase [Microdochium trichocladiopsis]